MNGRDLVIWRKQQGLTQKELAESLNVDVMTISRWERGVRGIPPHLPLALEALEHRFKKEVKNNDLLKGVRRSRSGIIKGGG
jgi:transcriptional regulator with XRE-family HTH domain